MRPVFLLINFLLLLSHFTYAREPLLIKNGEAEVMPGRQLELLADPGMSLRISDLLKSERHYKFRKSNRDVPVFLQGEGYVWARFSFNNQSGQLAWLEVGNPATDTVLFYKIVGHELKQAKIAGDKVAMASRDIHSNRLLFNLGRERGVQTVYLRLNIRLPRQFPLYLFTSASLIEYQAVNTLLNGLFYGFLGLLILYNLFLWIIVRDRSHIFYVLYILSSALALFHFDGLAYAYLWPSMPGINDHPAVISAFSILAAGLFVAEFLDLRNNDRRLYKGLILLAIALLSATALSLFGLKYASLSLVQLLAFIASGYFIIIGLSMLKRGFIPARFYLAAWSVLIAGVIIFLLKDLALIPYNSLSANALKFGIAAEAVLMAFALGDKINFYRTEREKAIQEKTRACIELPLRKKSS